MYPSRMVFSLLVLGIGFVGIRSFAGPNNILDRVCRCEFSGYSRSWELLFETTRHVRSAISMTLTDTGIARAYESGEAGKKACQELAELHLEETYCGYHDAVPYQT